MRSRRGPGGARRPGAGPASAAAAAPGRPVTAYVAGLDGSTTTPLNAATGKAGWKVKDPRAPFAITP